MFSCCLNTQKATEVPAATANDENRAEEQNASLAQTGNNTPAQPVVDPTDEDPEFIAIRDAFQVYDVNHDGVINKTELKGVLTHYHKTEPTDKQLGRIMNKVDLNSDGVIDFNEFAKMMRERTNTKNDLRSEFASWDENGDGYISRVELKKLLNSLEPTSDEEIDEILAMADSDNDGQINFEEFIKFFK